MNKCHLYFFFFFKAAHAKPFYEFLHILGEVYIFYVAFFNSEMTSTKYICCIVFPPDQMLFVAQEVLKNLNTEFCKAQQDFFDFRLFFNKCYLLWTSPRRKTKLTHTSYTSSALHNFQTCYSSSSQ